jgi:hypothetical protein
MFMELVVETEQFTRSSKPHCTPRCFQIVIAIRVAFGQPCGWPYEKALENHPFQRCQSLRCRGGRSAAYGFPPPRTRYRLQGTHGVASGVQRPAWWPADRRSQRVEDGCRASEGGRRLEAAAPTDEEEGDHRSTPLWFAVARGENVPLVRFLLTSGADPSYSLWAVVWRDDEVFCLELLKNRPRLNLRAYGETPIFYAARLKRLKTSPPDGILPDRHSTATRRAVAVSHT